MTIDITHLKVRLGGRIVVDDVNVRLERGGWLGLIGPNGAGKSTVLRAVTGLIDFEGEIRLEGATPAVKRHGAAQSVAYVPQRPILPPTMSVADYVMLGRTPHLSVFAMETRHDRRTVASVLDRLGLHEFASRPLGELSGGESQRVVLARALAQEAPVLVLDEPTSGLDLGHAQRVLELADELRHERRLTVICAMHDLTSAGQFADELLLLVKGKPVAWGIPADVLDERALGVFFDASLRVVNDPVAGLMVVARRTRRTANEEITALRSVCPIEACNPGPLLLVEEPLSSTPRSD